MAFDLNKNKPAIKAKLQFDLSKGENDVNTPKSRNWIIGLMLILLIGGGLWYYRAASSTEQSDRIAAISKDSSAIEKPSASLNLVVKKVDAAKVIVKDSNMSAPKADVPEDRKISAEALNNKVAATFGQGSSSFVGTNKLLVKQIIKYLAANPAAGININGYASSDGSLAVNQLISQNRADAFKKYLMQENIAESRITAMGKGIENPVASNETNSGRKKNRRVEINFQ